MEVDIQTRRLCGLLMMVLLFTVMRVKYASAETAFSSENSPSLANYSRVVCDICTEPTIAVECNEQHSFTNYGFGGINLEAAKWLPVQKILSDYLISVQEISKEIPLPVRQEEKSVIGYIHRQDGKKG